jgi:hypothetical protein
VLTLAYDVECFVHVVLLAVVFTLYFLWYYAINGGVVATVRIVLALSSIMTGIVVVVGLNLVIIVMGVGWWFWQWLVYFLVRLVASHIV